jgi:hypothetical protein
VIVYDAGVPDPVPATPFTKGTYPVTTPSGGVKLIVIEVVVELRRVIPTGAIFI